MDEVTVENDTNEPVVLGQVQPNIPADMEDVRGSLPTDTRLVPPSVLPDTPARVTTPSPGDSSTPSRLLLAGAPHYQAERPIVNPSS